MLADGKVLPAMEEYTSISVIGNAELNESSHEGEGTLMTIVGNTRDVQSNDDTAISSVPSNLSPIRQTLDLQSSSAANTYSGVPPPLVLKSAQAGSFRKPQHLRKTGTLPALIGVPQLSKADLKARQREHIECKAIPPKTHSLQDRAAYKIDQYISTRRGQTMSLACVGLVLMLIGACILKASQPGQKFHEMVWQSWTFLGDAGSHTSLTETGLRIIGVIMTLVGILYFSVIMGFVVDGIREKMDSLKKGKSKVAEDKHTLMLGWTDKSVSLIRQICLANASEKGGTIIVLAERDKEELEADLASQLRSEEMLGTRVIFRTGSPMLSVDLQKVAAHRARSIVILAQTTGDADRSDAAVLRTVLGLKTLPELSGHIVAELRDIDNEPLVRLVGGEEVEVLVSHDVIGRLVLMAARSPGLARVFTSLLGFDGNEFYFKEWPECTGVRFGDLTERFPDAIPLGIKRATGEVLIAPMANVVLNSGDQVMVLADDDDTYKACPPTDVDAGQLPVAVPKRDLNEKILMCGWRRDIRDMIKLLDACVLPRTELHMLCEEPCELRNKLLLESGLNVEELKNLRIIHHYGNTAIRRHLEPLPLHTFTSLMILADSSREDDIMHSDSHTLASLLLVRDLQIKMNQKAGRSSESIQRACRCICEVLDPRTQRTISTSETILKLSEFIQSNEIVSCILAMVSESRDVRVILDELLGPDGASFEMEPYSKYCASGEKVSFWQLAKRALKLDEILCGYQEHDAIDETILNPVRKQETRSWGGVDFIVLRQKNKTPIVHPSPQPLHVDDFERTTRSRMGKSVMTRHHLLEALVQEQEVSQIDSHPNQEELLLIQEVRSHVARIARRDSSIATASVDPKTAVRALVSVARLLADALEQYDSSHTKLSSDRPSPNDVATERFVK